MGWKDCLNLASGSDGGLTVVDEEEKLDIRQMHREGHSIKAIHRTTRRSINTIRRIVRGQYVRSKRKEKKSILDPFKEFIEEKFKLGRPVPRIMGDLRKMGYEGSKSQLYRFLKPLRIERRTIDKRTVRFETAPGEQAQMDWGHFGQFIDLDGKKRNLYLFACLLGYSRACYMEFTTQMQVPVLIACHIKAFDYFGGVPEKILYDNMRQVRKGPSQLNPAFVDFANYYGFHIQTCRPYRARTKGKVERLIRYFRDNFGGDRTFSSLEDANAQARHWMEYEANCRIHGTTGKRPIDLLSQEGLQDHRHMAPYRPVEKVRRKSDLEGFVRFQGNRYSVPPHAAGKTVEVEHLGATIRIYCEDLILTEHQQPEGKGKTAVHADHQAEMWRLTLARSAPPSKSTLHVFDAGVAVRDLEIYDAVCS